MAGLDRLVARAETLKIAQLLGVEPEALAYLQPCAPEDLAALRMQATDILFEGDAAALKRAADASGLLPTGLLATIAAKAMGPVLCGRLAGLLPADRAVAVAGKLAPDFLAQVAGETDPRRAIPVISRIPAEQAAAAARVLSRDRAYVAMGRFVAYLDPDALAACISELDDEALIRTAYTLEGKDRLDRLITLVGDDRLKALPETATAKGLWPEVVDLLAHLGPAQRERLRTLGGARAEARLREEAERLGVELD